MNDHDPRRPIPDDTTVPGTHALDTPGADAADRALDAAPVAPAGRAAPAWALQLEDGELRREVGLAPREAPHRVAPANHTERLRFHGDGSEYFRIWVVNLFFSLLTLGIYSAWAKVRKARWFAQHTSLAGDRFDYHGQPWRILAGRGVAIALLALWTFAFEASATVGLVVLALFCVVGPLLFASAQRFRLVNTSWRGLRFGFDVPRRDVYLVCVPLLLLWTAGSVLTHLGVREGWIVAAGLATFVGLPWAHARLKQLQHHHANFGEQQFSFAPAGSAFYGLYFKAFLLMIVGSLAAIPLLAMFAMSMTTQGSARGASTTVYAMLFGTAGVLFMWLAAWPYFAARMQQIVWSHTRLGHGVRFAGEMKGGKLWRIVTVQTLLTLVTLGLYWPFAAVAIARYRVESIVVEADAPIGDVAGALREERRAAGDAAIDFFGLDLGW